jgi:hypothetical protein
VSGADTPLDGRRPRGLVLGEREGADLPGDPAELSIWETLVSDSHTGALDAMRSGSASKRAFESASSTTPDPATLAVRRISRSRSHMRASLLIVVLASISTAACAMEPVEGDDDGYAAEFRRRPVSPPPTSRVKTIYEDANFTSIEECTSSCIFRTTVRGEFAEKTIKAFELVATRRDVIDDGASIGSKDFRCTRATATTPASCLAITQNRTFSDGDRWCSDGLATIVSWISLQDAEWGDPRSGQFAPLVAASAIDPGLIRCSFQPGSLIYSSPGGNVCSFEVGRVEKRFSSCGKEALQFLGF